MAGRFVVMAGHERATRFVMAGLDPATHQI
jgi:hypothetical protein